MNTRYLQKNNTLHYSVVWRCNNALFLHCSTHL